jgi:hypothetical protein
MAVRNMMNHLPDGPAIWPVRRFELRIGEPGHRSPQASRGLSNLLDKLGPVIGAHGVGKFEFSNWITKV